MKTSLLTVALFAATALPLWACQSGNAGQAADRSGNRDIYVSGQGAGDRVVQIPQDQTVSDSQAPYALRGNTHSRSGTDASVIHGATNGGY